MVTVNLNNQDKSNTFLINNIIALAIIENYYSFINLTKLTKKTEGRQSNFQIVYITRIR